MYDQWLRWCWWLLLVFVLLWTLICFVLLALQESGITSIGAFERLAVSTTGIVSEQKHCLHYTASEILLGMTPANYGFFLTRWDIGSATCSAAGSENYKHEVAEEAKDRSSLDLLYWPIRRQCISRTRVNIPR
ncbi:hypothetical protein HBH56_019900 [Parastagonospora nodorum]|nr:hypothetical protein HBH56_019900 [Parastagonospora nodorum]KAH4137384.1 hypothetical protein HBH45_126200 [Parastagonospora nodorum]KAH4199311.1 hypothetical protein HBI95_178010 [Parastagonospora nodorum]KAH4241953.1 hypothetical protein HBI06_020330 [Parastagonospora nodorum]KAH4265000.1 hypothetical protein HBI03_082870 [Parastagonospora nodorum]